MTKINKNYSFSSENYRKRETQINFIQITKLICQLTLFLQRKEKTI